MLGVPCRLIDLPAALEQWIRRHWGDGCPIDAPNDFRIDVAGVTSEPRAPAHAFAASQTALDGASLTWLRHAERWWSMGHAASGVSLRLFDRRARIRVWTDDDVRIEPTTLLALHVAFCEALRARGFVPLHAAVAVRDGRATAFLGPSGAGKSTMLLGAIDDGWLPLAEDFAWLDPATCRVHAWRGEVGVRLDHAGLNRLGARARSGAWRPRPDGKLELAFDEAADERPMSAELTRIVLLTRGDSRDSTMHPISPRAAVRAIWESAGVPLCRLNCEAFAARVPALMARLEWRRLTLGRERPTL